jgi:mono/diheme cytochrome c family protein
MRDVRMMSRPWYVRRSIDTQPRDSNIGKCRFDRTRPLERKTRMMTSGLKNLLTAVALAGLSLAVPGLAAGADAPPDKKTMRQWKAKCASCHGEDGKGKTEQGAKMGTGDMTTAAFWKDITDEQATKAVADGFKRTKGGKAQEMEPMKDKLKPPEVDALVALAKSFKK